MKETKHIRILAFGVERLSLEIATDP